MALHGDAFAAATEARLVAGLRALDDTPAESRDGGEHLTVFRVPPGTGHIEPAAAWAALAPTWDIDVTPARVVGTTPPPIGEAQMRTQVIFATDTSDAQVTVQWEPPDGVPVVRSLSAAGDVPAADRSGRVWTDWWSGDVPTSATVTVNVTGTGGPQVAWSGEVTRVSAQDRLVLRERADAPGTFRPVATGAEATAGPATSASADTAALGWLVVLAAALGPALVRPAPRRLGVVALVALGLGLGTGGVARAQPLPQLPVSSVDEPGLILVVADPEGLLGPTPTAFIEGQIVTLHDDGVAPDASASDGVFSGIAVGPVDPRMDLTLLGANSEIAWQDELRIDMVQPVVRVSLSGAGTKVHLSPLATETRHTTPVGGGGGWLTLLVALVASLAGFIYGQLRRQDPQPLRWASLDDAPRAPAKVSRQTAHSPDAVRAALRKAVEDTEAARVLVLPRPDLPLTAPLPGAVALQVERPSASAVRTAMVSLVAPLPANGQLAVLIEGPAALAPPAGDEPPTAVLDELLATLPAGVHASVWTVGEDTPS